MGEAKRRRDEATAALAAHAGVMHDEGQGVWVLESYSAAILPAVVIEAALGDPQAGRLLQFFTAVADGILKAPADDPYLCLICANSFTANGVPPAEVWVLRPHVDDSSNVLVQAMCESCCRSLSVHERKQRAKASIRDGLIPDLREIPLPTAAGHA